MNLTRLKSKIANPEPVPKGWHTLAALAEKWRKSASRTAEILRQAQAAGLVERKEFKLLSKGRMVPVPHYRER